MLFDWHRAFVPSWPPLEVVLRALVMFALVQIGFRVTGRKEMTRYAAHDVALLLLLAAAGRRAIVGTDDSLTTAAIALATLFGANWALSAAARRWRRASLFWEGPVLAIIKDGALDVAALRRARVSEDELRSSLRRQHGTADLGRVRAAYLERSGALSFQLDG